LDNFATTEEKFCMRIFYIFILLCFISKSFAQSMTFEFDPTDQYEKTSSSTYYSEHKVFVANLTGVQLVLGWTSISVDCPDEWEIDICDYVTCYEGIPDSGLMLAISDTTRGYLKLTLDPNGYVGTGTFVFQVYDNKYPFLADTLTFTIHTAVMTDVSEAEKQSGLFISPNPVSDNFAISNLNEPANSLALYNLSGQKVYEHKIVAEDQQFAVNDLQNGIYLAVLKNEETIVAHEKLIVRH